jgi:hypothetical protein
MELVNFHHLIPNTFGRRRPFPVSIEAGYPKGSKKRCACGAPDCYGAEIGAKLMIDKNRVASNLPAPVEGL